MAAGGLVGGVAGGAVAGATFGTLALAFIPMLGVAILATGMAAGAVVGQTVESHARTLGYPELISIPMNCPELATPGRSPPTRGRAGAAGARACKGAGCRCRPG